MPVVLSAATALPEHRYSQDEIAEAFADLMATSGDPQLLGRIRRIHAATGVRARHLTLALGEYGPLDDFGKANDVFLREAPPLAARAVADALAQAGLAASDVDVIASATVTGVATPSVDARLVPLLGLRPDVRRMPLVGLGCVAGASGVARIAETLRGDPDAVAVLVCVELCSLTLQHDDSSMANIVASGLFGDGAVAVVMVGSRRAVRLGVNRPRVVDAHSHFFADTERVMGWDVGSSGLRVVLSPEVPHLVGAQMRTVTDVLLSRHRFEPGDIRTWIAHSGGPKVLTALEGALDLDAADTALTWQSLRDIGNLSSASVLDVLRRTLEVRPAGTEEPALMLAMGPGFCAELVLLEW